MTSMDSSVDRIDAPAGKGDLPAMTRDVIRAPDIDHVQLAVALEQRYQHCRGIGAVRERLPRRRLDAHQFQPNLFDLVFK